MSTQAIITLCVFVAVIILLIWKPIHPIVIGASIPTVLALTGVLDPATAFSDFANTTVIFFMGLLVVGGAIFKTGLADFIGEKIIGLIGRSEKGVILGASFVAVLLSSVLNDTGTTGCLIPISGAMGRKAGVHLSKIYMALAFFASLGGTITLGAVQAFLQYVNQIAEPVTEASYVITSLQAAIAGAERVFALLDEEEERPDAAGDASVITQGHVEFRHVRFGYTPERTLIHDLNLEVRPNEMVAIVGPTGGGKTTLVNLLMRFYELDGGSISIDGQDITALPRGKLRRRIGMVLQDAWLFEGTIAENIAYGRRDATREEIVAAARAACCDHFIRTLPQGYDTPLSGETTGVSQGQMQLLTIARAMLTDPAILVLDEATSSVDTRTEVEIQKAMARLMEGKTSFVIAHRLSTIRSADLILVVRDGDIVERGTHRELMARNGFYASLYRSQFEAA